MSEMTPARKEPNKLPNCLLCCTRSHPIHLRHLDAGSLSNYQTNQRGLSLCPHTFYNTTQSKFIRYWRPRNSPRHTILQDAKTAEAARELQCGVHGGLSMEWDTFLCTRLSNSPRGRGEVRASEGSYISKGSFVRYASRARSTLPSYRSLDPSSNRTQTVSLSSNHTFGLSMTTRTCANVFLRSLHSSAST